MRDKARSQYKDKPVAFLTVSVGGSACSESKRFAAVHDSPIFADSNGLTAGAFGVAVDEGAQYEFRVVDTEGRMVGSWQTANRSPNNIRKCVDKSLPEARWFYGDIQTPGPLRNAVDLLELGQYELALPRLMLHSRNRNLQRAAKTVIKKVEEIAAGEFAEAEALRDEGRIVQAYFAFEEIAGAFRGLDASEHAAGEMRRLKSRREVARELKARAFYRQALRLASSNKLNERRQAPLLFRRIAEAFKGTRAAGLAQARLQVVSR